MSDTPKSADCVSVPRELLPCPFCGPGQSKVGLWFDDISKRWRVGCCRCGCSTGTSPRDDGEQPAVDRWNKRGHDAPALEIINAVIDRAEQACRYALKHQNFEDEGEYKDGWEVAAKVCEGAIRPAVEKHIWDDVLARALSPDPTRAALEQCVKAMEPWVEHVHALRDCWADQAVVVNEFIAGSDLVIGDVEDIRKMARTLTTVRNALDGTGE